MSRQANKERTRNRLVQAILKVLYKHGPAALTTGRVAELAGVAQPTFYVHFKDMDDALERVAAWVADQLVIRLSEGADSVSTESVAALTDAIGATLRAFVADPKTAELFLRHRRDASSPIGRRWTKITDGLRGRAIEQLQGLEMRAPATDVPIYADLLIGMIFALIEGLVDKRITDLDHAAEIAARTTLAGIGAAAAVSDAA